ncbi:Glucuronosyltransferase [Aphelenchoides bicaudatus]|nr:Glucuronosyltransferase [Aphelenchoides bicaudatus]
MNAFFVIFVLLFHFVHSANVLFFLIGTNAFDRHIFEFIAQQIALRHHNVVTIKPVLIPEEPRLVKPRLHMVREKMIKNTLPSHMYEPLERIGSDVPWRKTYELDAHVEPLWKAHNHSCGMLLNSNLMETLKRDQVEVAVVYSGNPCQLAFVHSLGIPFIYYDLDGLTDETVVASGMSWNLNAPSSRLTSQFDSNYSVVRQLFNGLQLVRESICQGGWTKLSSLICPRVAQMDEPIGRMFNEDYYMAKRFKPFPPVNWIKQNAELYLVNTDPLIETPETPFSTHMIPVGGAHIDHARPLFAPWNTSVGIGQLGMIIVQLGANTDSSEMPSHLAKAFVGAFSRLKKYRIFWRIGPNLKLNGIDLDALPSHINVTTYVPQNDLLANKRTKLLITNGGMSSIMEAVQYGVPMLGIPLYGNNYQTLTKMQQKGLGVTLDKNSITETTLYAAIRQVVDNPKYERNAQEIAKEFAERSYTPFDLVLNSIEHVSRHRSAKFLRSVEKPKGIWLFLRATNIDVYFISIALLIFVSFIAFTVLRSFVNFFFFSSKKTSKVDKKQETKKNR